MIIKTINLSLLAFGLVALGACHKPRTSTSIGTCNEQSVQCGIHLQEEGKGARDLKCTPPDTKLPMACACLEDGLEKKRVSIVMPLPTELQTAESFARYTCGWQ